MYVADSMVLYQKQSWRQTLFIFLGFRITKPIETSFINKSIINIGEQNDSDIFIRNKELNPVSCFMLLADF